MNLKLSFHARLQHRGETWNAVTIVKAYDRGHLGGVKLLEGKTCNVLYGFTRTGECVGLVLSKPKGGTYIVSTGFAASEEYWKATAT